MTHVYAPTYQAVKVAQILENSSLEGDDFTQAQVKLARVADDAFQRLRVAAFQQVHVNGQATKEAMVVGVLDTVMTLHEAHVDSGAKLAASPDHLAELLTKLAAAVMVDEVLLEQLPMLEGGSKTSAEACQLLGREYIMSLIGEVLP